MATEKWVLGLTSLVVAGVTGFKAYDDYLKSSAAALASMTAFDQASRTQAPSEAHSALMRAGNEYAGAKASYWRAAIAFGAGSLISAGLATYVLWPRRKR